MLNANPVLVAYCLEPDVTVDLIPYSCVHAAYVPYIVHTQFSSVIFTKAVVRIAKYHQPI